MGFALPLGVLGSVVTDREGRIVELNDAAADLLKITRKGLEQRPCRFEMFFSASSPVILTALAAATPTTSDPIAVSVRPREHGPRSVVVTVQEASDGYLEWTINPSGNMRLEAPPSYRQTESLHD